MKIRLNFKACAVALLLGWMGLEGVTQAQDGPRITGIQRLPNREIQLNLSATTGADYRLDASSDLVNWVSLITLRSLGVDQHTDSGAPYLNARFYRAVPVTGAPPLSGDHLPTANGDLVIHPLFHASLVLSWNGKTIYNDPDDDSAFQARYQGLPPADLILVSHSHGDHFSSAKIEAVRAPNAVIIAPQAVYNGLTAAQKALTIVLANGKATNVLGLTVDAIPAYNGNHPVGSGNGYVLTLGGKRVYMSGDTGNIPEMRALQDIDVAFVCINTPFTMTVNEATNAVRSFRPKVIYPYHYRNSDGSTANATTFRQQLGNDSGVEVRLRKWY